MSLLVDAATDDHFLFHNDFICQVSAPLSTSVVSQASPPPSTSVVGTASPPPVSSETVAPPVFQPHIMP